MKTEIYFNLRKKIFSVRQQGKVIQHTGEIFLDQAQFIVNPAGRARVLREKGKNVHAFVRGQVGEPAECREIARYNPYLFDSFVDKDGQPVKFAEKVHLFVRGGKPVILFF